MKNNLFVTIREAKKRFQLKINPKKYDWIEAAAEDGYTNKKNFDDLKFLKLIPLLLKKPKKIFLKKKFLNVYINSALVCCPMGHQTQFDRDGEIETIKYRLLYALLIKMIQENNELSKQNKSMIDKLVGLL